MKALITGITGFVGSHLAEFLLQQGLEVYGTRRWRSHHENIAHLENKIGLIECDIRDAVSVRRVLSDIQPDHIYHLAAQSSVSTSWNAPAETLTTNILGQLNLFEACRTLGISPLLLVAGSSEEYGFVYPDEVPIRETNPLRPSSPYGVSKVAQDLMAYQYHRSYGLPVVRMRAFNHTGPRHGAVFATSDFARQIAFIEKKRQAPVVKVGNLEAMRDFTDVRDVVRGYWLALTTAKAGEVYNLCSGRAVSIGQVLDILVSHARTRICIEQDPERLRPSDVPILLGDYSKLHAQTAWEPRIPIEDALRDLLAYWRERLA